MGPNSAIDFSSSSKLETLSVELACSRNETTFSGYLSGDPFSGLESSEKATPSDKFERLSAESFDADRPKYGFFRGFLFDYLRGDVFIY